MDVAGELVVLQGLLRRHGGSILSHALNKRDTGAVGSVLAALEGNIGLQDVIGEQNAAGARADAARGGCAAGIVQQAAACGRPMLAMLLQAGASVPCDVLPWLCRHQASAVVGPYVLFLVQHGASVTAVDDTGATALHFVADAAEMRHLGSTQRIKLAKLLLSLGASARVYDTRCATPATLANASLLVDMRRVLQSWHCARCGKGSAYTPCTHCFDTAYCSRQCRADHLATHSFLCDKSRDLLRGGK